jgi:hypothetical protein
MIRLSYLVGLVLPVVLLMLGAGATQKTQARGAAVKITNAIPATSQIGKIFETSLNINYDGGRIILAGNEQGTGRMFVDDNLYIDVTRPDGRTGTEVTYRQRIGGFTPRDLAPYFNHRTTGMGSAPLVRRISRRILIWGLTGS